MLKAPCRNCTDRYLGYHDHCEKYKDYDVERERIHDIAAKQKQINYDYYKVRRHHLKRSVRK